MLLLMHGNPTYSFLYRELISGLRNRFRCIAIDYPGFGLSTAPPGYGFTPAEHADVVEKLVQQLDLTGITMMVQDWGGPIGFAVATRNPDRFSAFVIGNTGHGPSPIRAPRSSRGHSAARSAGTSSEGGTSSSSGSSLAVCGAGSCRPR